MIGRLTTDGRSPATVRSASIRSLRQPSRVRIHTPSPAPDPVPVWERKLTTERVAIRVREAEEVLYPVRWYRWITAADERTCPECGGLAGHTWSEQQPGSSPPLHVNCRCRVALDHLEWRVRYVARWRTRWVTQPTWAWQRTGWE